MNAASPLTRARRIVVKVGSALLVDQSSGQVNRPWLETLVEDLLRLRARQQEVVLVSSGAIALGRRELKLAPGPLKLEESQAAAAVGQIALAHIYKELFARSGVTVAQILLTLEDSERRRRYLNARATLSELLELGALPVINENDTVATTEIRYGDNDRLAARVAQMVERGLPAAAVGRLRPVHVRPEPGSDGAADSRNPRHHARDRSDGWRFGLRGGLGRHGDEDRRGEDRHGGRLRHGHRRRRAAASRAPARRGRRLQLVPAVGRIPENARKQWIAGSPAPERRDHDRCGALQALRSGKSLLPAGVTAVSGRFARGDTVSVLERDGAEIARGMIAYSDRDAARIIGKRSADIEALLGFRGRAEMIHRDDLVLMRADLASV